MNFTFNRIISNQKHLFGRRNGRISPRPCSFLQNTRKLSTSAKVQNVKTVLGEVVDAEVDLRNARPGDKIEIPYELTVSQGFEDFWHSSFYSNERLYTSTPFARDLGFQGQVLPFSLMLFLSSSMSHADSAKVHLGFSNAKYHWPGFAGDTFKKKLEIQSIRPTSDGNHSIFTFQCQLVNQRERTCFSCLKSMVFPFSVPASEITAENDEAQTDESLKKHILSRAGTILSLGNQTLRRLHKGQLILHRMSRPLTETQTMQLASTARLTHARHFNRHKFARHEIYIPGGCIYGLTMSASARDIHEKLHEELTSCSFINTLFPGETMGAMSFIKDVEDHVSGNLEILTINTFGIKNMDVVTELSGKPLPLELFTKQNLLPKQIEAICDAHIPELSKKIVVQAERKILRQAPVHESFLL